MFYLNVNKPREAITTKPRFDVTRNFFDVIADKCYYLNSISPFLSFQFAIRYTFLANFIFHPVPFHSQIITEINFVLPLRKVFAKALNEKNVIQQTVIELPERWAALHCQFLKLLHDDPFL